ncbi:MAG: hypothetical protein ACRCXB_34915 [Aeromonadaceae bacterium]
MKISKSKKELARIISEHGGWRYGEFAAQNGDDCAVWFYGNAPVRSSGAWWVTSGSGLGHCGIKDVAKLPNWHQTILSRAEYFHLYPAPDADGWIEWGGSPRSPVSKGTAVDVKMQNGTQHFGQLIDDECWSDCWSGANIIAYRPHKPEQVKHGFCESVMRSIPEPEFDDAGSRLAKALELVKSAAPHMLIDKYKFDGNEVMGERKPTIEQLAQDYRNKLDYSNRKQDEADKANMESDAALAQLEDAIAEIGFAITPLAATEKEPELSITNWRDLRVGDVIELTGSLNPCWKEHAGIEMTVKEIHHDQGDGDDQVDLLGESGCWSLGGNTTWRFIRRP